MDVYIETVLIDNFFITWLLAILTYRAMSLKISYLRVVIAATVGTLMALVFPFIEFHFALMLLIRLAVFVILSFILFFKRKKLILSSLVFLVFTFTFGGALFALGLIVHGTVYDALTKPIANLPVGAIIFAALLLYFLIKKAVRKLKRMHLTRSLTTKVDLQVLGKKLELNAFLDTGNVLYDKKTDMPVVVLSANASLKILGDHGLSAMLRGKLFEIDKSAHYMYFNTLDAKQTKLLILEPTEFLVYNGQVQHKIEGIVLGLTLGASNSFIGQFDILLHPAIYDSNLNLQPVQSTQNTNIRSF